MAAVLLVLAFVYSPSIRALGKTLRWSVATSAVVLRSLPGVYSACTSVMALCSGVFGEEILESHVRDGVWWEAFDSHAECGQLAALILGALSTLPCWDEKVACALRFWT